MYIPWIESADFGWWSESRWQVLGVVSRSEVSWTGIGQQIEFYKPDKQV